MSKTYAKHMECYDLPSKLGWCPDETIRIDALIKVLQSCQKKFGKRSCIFLNAGYNNISAYILPSKKVGK